MGHCSIFYKINSNKNRNNGIHTNPIYRQTDDARSLKFALDTGFGQLMVLADLVPLVAHIPLLVCVQTHEIELHLMRSNPIARILKKHQN